MWVINRCMNHWRDAIYHHIWNVECPKTENAYMHHRFNMACCISLCCNPMPYDLCIVFERMCMWVWAMGHVSHCPLPASSHCGCVRVVVWSYHHLDQSTANTFCIFTYTACMPHERMLLTSHSYQSIAGLAWLQNNMFIRLLYTSSVCGLDYVRLCIHTFTSIQLTN